MFTSLLMWVSAWALSAQEIVMDESAALTQVYGESVRSDALLPMNDLGMEAGYVLYETDITVDEDGEQTLSVENVRDHAAVCLDGQLLGGLSDGKKELVFRSEAGAHKLRIYVENIGRVTYGPEILDNSKGIFGSITLNDTDLEQWNMIPLRIRDCSVSALRFGPRQTDGLPCFRRGQFTVDAVGDVYVDVSGWSMGEIWINGQYIGTYWEENSQQTLQVPKEILSKGNNSIVAFELRNSGKASMRLTDAVVFK